jgi:hypothetical protein
MIWALDMLGPSCIVILREVGERACIKCMCLLQLLGVGEGGGGGEERGGTEKRKINADSESESGVTRRQLRQQENELSFLSIEERF